MRQSSAILSGTYFAAFFLAAHLALRAATIRARPSGLNPRFCFGLVAVGVETDLGRPGRFLATAPVIAARACWSRAISASIKLIMVVLMGTSVT
jgi:hypothetical protein